MLMRELQVTVFVSQNSTEGSLNPTAVVDIVDRIRVSGRLDPLSSPFSAVIILSGWCCEEDQAKIR